MTRTGSRRPGARAGSLGLIALTGAVVAATMIVADPGGGSPVDPATSTVGAFRLEYAIAFGLVATAFSVVGSLIVARQPSNLLGWLLLADAAVASTSILAYAYAYRALVIEGGAWPGGALAGQFSDAMYAPTLALLTASLFLLYPEGRLRTRGERRTAWVLAAGVAVSIVGALLAPSLYAFPEVENPLGLAVPETLQFAIGMLGFSLVVSGIVASLVILVRRVRRSQGRERDQLRLLVWGAIVGTVLFVPSFIQSEPSNLAVFLGAGGVVLIPASVGVAILRHRLFDLDVVVRRTVVFGLLAAFITAIYVAVVVAIPALLVGPSEAGFDLLPFAAAAVIALAFQPVRRRAQQIASRLVYGDRASPYDVLAELASRMSETYDAVELLPRIAQGLAQGSGARRAEVWLRIGRELRRSAVWPAEEAQPPAVPAPDDGLPELPAEHAVAVRHQGELLGAITVDTAAGVELTATEERLLDDVASQAGIALRNARLTEELRAHVDELRASRQRLVAAQDTERRRLERDIHDGAQQQLVALAVKARLAEQLAERDAAKARDVMGEVREEATEALETLRDLARGIYPPVLADRGLVEALEAQVRKAPVPVRIAADGVGRYPQEVEATLYFCCLEAVQNAAKYAEAASVRIELAQRDGTLVFRVADDGRGFDPQVTPPGMGLTNMRDRVEASGGSLEIHATPGAGTIIEGSVPATPA